MTRWYNDGVAVAAFVFLVFSLTLAVWACVGSVRVGAYVFSPLALLVSVVLGAWAYDGRRKADELARMVAQKMTEQR